jgi:hypothetical protein
MSKFSALMDLTLAMLEMFPAENSPPRHGGTEKITISRRLRWYTQINKTQKSSNILQDSAAPSAQRSSALISGERRFSPCLSASVVKFLYIPALWQISG